MPEILGVSVERSVLVAHEQRAIVACVEIAIRGVSVRLTAKNARLLAKALAREANAADAAAKVALEGVNRG